MSDFKAYSRDSLAAPLEPTGQESPTLQLRRMKLIVFNFKIDLFNSSSLSSPANANLKTRVTQLCTRVNNAADIDTFRSCMKELRVPFAQLLKDMPSWEFLQITKSERYRGTSVFFKELKQLAELYRQLGAVKTARDPEAASYFYFDLVLRFLSFGEIETAEKILEQIKDPCYLYRAQKKVIKTLIDNKQFMGAMKIAQCIVDGINSREMVIAILKAIAEADSDLKSKLVVNDEGINSEISDKTPTYRDPSLYGLRKAILDFLEALSQDSRCHQKDVQEFIQAVKWTTWAFTCEEALLRLHTQRIPIAKFLSKFPMTEELHTRIAQSVLCLGSQNLPNDVWLLANVYKQLDGMEQLTDEESYLNSCRARQYANQGNLPAAENAAMGTTREIDRFRAIKAVVTAWSEEKQFHLAKAATECLNTKNKYELQVSILKTMYHTLGSQSIVEEVRSIPAHYMWRYWPQGEWRDVIDDDAPLCHGWRTSIASTAAATAALTSSATPTDKRLRISIQNTTN